MKNSSKKNFLGKNNKEYKKNSDFGHYSKNTKRSEKNERILNNSPKNKNIENLNKNYKNNTFSSIKSRKPIFKYNTEFPNTKAILILNFILKRQILRKKIITF